MCENEEWGVAAYWATRGQLDIVLREADADIRLSDLELAPEFDGDTLYIPVIEVTGVPVSVCKYDDTCTW